MIFRGLYNFKYFSIHVAEVARNKTDYRTVSARGRNPLASGETMTMARKQIDARSRNMGENAYYFAPREQLSAGKYVAWIDKEFWLFELY